MNNSNQEPSPQETDSASGEPHAELDFETRRQAAVEKFQGMKPAETEPEAPPNDPNNPGNLPAKADEPPKEEKPRTDKGQFTLDRKQVNKWLTENPDEVARLFPDTDVAIRNQHISIAKKRQKAVRDAEAREQGIAEMQEKLESQGKTQDEAIASAMETALPGLDLLTAIGNLDFAAVDVAFSQQGTKFDDYIKKRLRKGVDSVRRTAEAKEIAELKAKLAAKDAPPEDKVADTETETETTPETTPAYTVKTIEAEVDEDHGVRNVADWQKKVQSAAGDEDDEVAIEDAADKVLAEAKRKMGFTDDEEPAPKGRKRRVKKEVDAADEWTGDIADFEGRAEWAKNRARNR